MILGKLFFSIVIGTICFLNAQAAVIANPNSATALWIIAGGLMTLNGKVVFDWLKNRNGNSVQAKLHACLEGLIKQHNRTEPVYLAAAANVKETKAAEIRREQYLMDIRDGINSMKTTLEERLPKKG